MTYNVFSGTLNPTHFTSLHFIFHKVAVVCFPGMISSLAKNVNKSSDAHFQTLFFLKFSYFLMFLSIEIDMIILQTDDEQFTVTTNKDHSGSPLTSAIC